MIELLKKRLSRDRDDEVELAEADEVGNGSGSTSARTRAGVARIAAPPVPKAMAPSAVRVIPGIFRAEDDVAMTISADFPRIYPSFASSASTCAN